MRYDRVYQILADRAVGHAMIDVESFVAQLVEQGVAPERIEQMLLRDLETGGPVFGKFFRSLDAAANGAALAAWRQGVKVGGILELDAEIAEYTRINRMSDVILGDPDALDDIEQRAGDMPHTWVAMMRNTCDRCLPLHGRTMTLSMWQALGLDPATIHDGWNTSCFCTLVPEEEANKYQSIQQNPLVRIKDQEGVRGGKKTIRALGDKDIERSQQAVDKARESESGRALLQDLGRALG